RRKKKNACRRMFPSSGAKATKGGSLIGRASAVAQGLCAGLVLLLAACGRGSSAPDPSTALGLTASPHSLTFSQPEGGSAPAAQTVALSELGNASYPWSAAVLYGYERDWLNVNGASQASGPSLPSSISV